MIRGNFTGPIELLVSVRAAHLYRAYRSRRRIKAPAGKEKKLLLHGLWLQGFVEYFRSQDIIITANIQVKQHTLSMFFSF